MSYILDALNKAERERGAKSMPAPLSEHAFRRVRGNRLWLGFGALVAGAAAAIWFWLPARITVSRVPESAVGASVDQAAGRAEKEPPQKPVPAEASSLPNSSPELPPAPQSAPAKGVTVSQDLKPGAASTPVHTPESAIVSQESGAGKPADDIHHPSPFSQTGIASQSDPSAQKALPPADQASPQAHMPPIPVAEATHDVPSPPPAVDAKIVSLREALDKMTISVLMYVEAKSERRVYINGRKYVEGDYVDGRYLVESITLEGVVLSYEGERALLRSRPK